MNKYGREFPVDWTELMIELACYNFDHQPAAGGLGRQGHLKNAMQTLWPHIYAGEIAPGVPRWREDLELMTWAWCKYKVIAVIGHASAGKTHTFAHIAVASYLADAFNTIVTLTSTHLPGLRKRLWADVQSAVSTNSGGYALYVKNYDLTMRPAENQSENKYIIEGIAVDRGLDAVERIQGNHSRRNRFVVIDEAQGTPSAVFDAMSNLMTDPNFKVVMLANPTKKFSEFGSWCEPEAGWNDIDPDKDIWWETKRGGVCIRLDGMRSPNIVNGKKLFPFLIDEEYTRQVEHSYGRNSPRWWAFVRGWFPPDGSLGYIFPSTVLAKMEDRHVYTYQPTLVAAFDPAFEGGDDRMLVIGEYGPINDNPWALNVNEVTPVNVEVSERGEPIDYLIAHKLREILEDRGVSPENLIIDTTGAGRSVHAILAKEWSPRIEKCNFGGKPTDRTLKVGEDETCAELYDRFVSELWYSARAWAEEGMIGGVADRTLITQLAGREYETVNDKKVSIETKREYKRKLGQSPDAADAFVMLVELLKRRGGKAGRPSDFRGGTRRQRLQAMARRTNLVEAWA